MKKVIPLILVCVMLLSSCSYVAEGDWLQPYIPDNNDNVYQLDPFDIKEVTPDEDLKAKNANPPNWQGNNYGAPVPGMNNVTNNNAYGVTVGGTSDSLVQSPIFTDLVFPYKSSVSYTSHFGWRRLDTPGYTSADHRFHNGADLAGMGSKEIVASADGVVVGKGPTGDGYGNWLAVRYDQPASVADADLFKTYAKYATYKMDVPNGWKAVPELAADGVNFTGNTLPTLYLEPLKEALARNQVVAKAVQEREAGYDLTKRLNRLKTEAAKVAGVTNPETVYKDPRTWILLLNYANTGEVWMSVKDPNNPNKLIPVKDPVFRPGDAELFKTGDEWTIMKNRIKTDSWWARNPDNYASRWGNLFTTDLENWTSVGSQPFFTFVLEKGIETLHPTEGKVTDAKEDTNSYLSIGFQQMNRGNAQTVLNGIAEALGGGGSPLKSVVLFYAHLSSYASGIGSGSTVTKGQTLGIEGATGNVTGSHLHLCAYFGDSWDINRIYAKVNSSGYSLVDPMEKVFGVVDSSSAQQKLGISITATPSSTHSQRAGWISIEYYKFNKDNGVTVFEWSGGD